MQTSQPARLLGPSHFKDSPIAGVSARFVLAPAYDDSLPDASLVIVNSPVGGAEVSTGFKFTVEFESAEWQIAVLEV